MQRKIRIFLQPLRIIDFYSIVEFFTKNERELFTPKKKTHHKKRLKESKKNPKTLWKLKLSSII